MSGRVLLDTNIVVAIVAGDRNTLDRLAESEGFVSPTVLGELYYGAEKSTRREENRSRIDTLCERLAILPIDRETAEQYGRIKNQLRETGRPIPENDIWVAACAARHALTLVSRDSHFRAVNGLSLEEW